LSDEITIEPSEFAPNHSPTRVRANGKAVTLTAREVLEATVRESDNTAADALLRLAGGPAAVTRTLSSAGVTGIDISRTKKQLGADLERPGGAEALVTDGRDTTTPAAMLALLERFYSRKLGLSAESHELLVHLMTTTETGQRRIQAGAPAGSAVTHKTGTLPGTVNDVGVITSPNGKDHVLIAVFTKGGRASTLSQRERAVASITRAIYRDFIGWPEASPRQ
jgi:beta-lactamase class A